FRDIEKVAMALAPLGPVFEPENPVTHLIADQTTGRLREGILDEKVLSAIIEFKTVMEKIPAFLSALEKVQHEIDTVMSVGVASRCLPDGSIPHEEWVRKAGYPLSPNGKTNLGLGRPLFREEAA
ncbi:MAG: 4Fe-4S ferredoxin, partial [Thermodesulfobacteriota bacterium]